MKPKSGNIILKSILLAIIAAGGSLVFRSYLLIPARLQLTVRTDISLSATILTLWWAFLLLISFDLLFRKKFSLFTAPCLYAFTFFMANDALWAANLLWQKNQVPIAACLSIYLLAMLLVIYRIDTQFNWLFKNKTNPQPQKAKAEWKALGHWNKLLLILGLSALSWLTLYVPYQVLLTAGYLLGKQPATIQAKVTGNGSIRGKYFYHRYWKLEFNGKQEKFWVWAASETEPVEAHSCATVPDPSPGTTLILKVRKGPFGISYDRILQMQDENSQVICE